MPARLLLARERTPMLSIRPKGVLMLHNAPSSETVEPCEQQEGF